VRTACPGSNNKGFGGRGVIYLVPSRIPMRSGTTAGINLSGPVQMDGGGGLPKSAKSVWVLAACSGEQSRRTSLGAMRLTAIPREGKAKACNPCRPARWEQPIGHLPEAVQTAPMRPASFCKWQQQLFKPLQQLMLQVEGWSKRRGIAPAVNGANKAKKETPTAEMRRARWTNSRTNALAAPLAWTLIV